MGQVTSDARFLQSDYTTSHCRRSANVDKERLETFSDGVIAVVITVMLIQLRVPSSSTWKSLPEESSVFLGYVLNFTYVGIS